MGRDKRDAITKADLARAEGIAGLEFSKNEREAAANVPEVQLLQTEFDAVGRRRLELAREIAAGGDPRDNPALLREFQQSVRDSEKDRIAIIHQELALSPYLPIFENLFLGHMKTRFGRRTSGTVELQKRRNSPGLT